MTKNTIAIVVGEGGIVRSQNRAAEELLGNGVGERCWRLVGDQAHRPPCTIGCTARRIHSGEDYHGRIQFPREGRFHLHCLPTQHRIVCLMTPDHSLPTKAGKYLRPREVQVLTLLSQGYTTIRIGEALGIKNGTVRAHVENMRKRIGARTQGELVARGFELGYLSAPLFRAATK